MTRFTTGHPVVQADSILNVQTAGAGLPLDVVIRTASGSIPWLRRAPIPVRRTFERRHPARWWSTGSRW
jgi:hypothetical protein